MAEEIKRLEETLPPDLAKAFKRRDIEIPRDANNLHQQGYKGINDKREVVDYGWAAQEYKDSKLVDFENSTYEKITPEEALRKYKAGDGRNVYAILGGKLVNAYWVDNNGSKIRQYDYKASRDYYTMEQGKKQGKDPFLKSNGKIGRTSTDLSPKEIYNNASAIYYANEVSLDPQKIKDRRLNPESKYVNPSAQKSGKRPIIDFTDEASRQIMDNDTGNQMDLITDLGNGIVKIPRDWRTSEVAGEGDANYWLAKYKKLADAYGRSHRFVRWAYQAYILAKTGKKSYVDTITGGTRKDNKANIRYTDAENALKEPIEKARQALKDIDSLERRKISKEQDRDAFANPTARRRREGDLKSDIRYQKQYILRYLAELERLEGKLEDLDASDKAKIQEYDDAITAILNDLNTKRAEWNNLKQGGLYKNSPISNKVPESLELEEQSLAELTDKKMGIKHKDPLKKKKN